MSFRNFYHKEDVTRAALSTYMKDDGTWEDKDGTEFSTEKFHKKLGVRMKKKKDEKPKAENKKVEKPKAENKKVEKPKAENNDVYKTAIDQANYFIYDNLD